LAPNLEELGNLGILTGGNRKKKKEAYFKFRYFSGAEEKQGEVGYINIVGKNP